MERLCQMGIQRAKGFPKWDPESWAVHAATLACISCSSGGSLALLWGSAPGWWRKYLFHAWGSGVAWGLCGAGARSGLNPAQVSISESPADTQLLPRRGASSCREEAGRQAPFISSLMFPAPFP